MGVPIAPPTTPAMTSGAKPAPKLTPKKPTLPVPFTRTVASHSKPPLPCTDPIVHTSCSSSSSSFTKPLDHPRPLFSLTEGILPVGWPKQKPKRQKTRKQ